MDLSVLRSFDKFRAWFDWDTPRDLPIVAFLIIVLVIVIVDVLGR